MYFDLKITLVKIIFFKVEFRAFNYNPKDLMLFLYFSKNEK